MQKNHQKYNIPNDLISHTLKASSKDP